MVGNINNWIHRPLMTSAPARITTDTSRASLVLGGVQFGLPYGIANTTGCPADSELRRIIALAESGGVTHLDTAAGYGESEERIGAVLTIDSPIKIVTKLPPDVSTAQGARAAVTQSMQRLKRTCLGGVLLHRFEHFRADDGAIWQVLLEEKARSRIDRIGVSVHLPEQLRALLNEPNVDLIQLPFNILDQRWLAPDLQDAVAARSDVTLHGRSALLQGLLNLKDAAHWPCEPLLAKHCIATLQDLTELFSRQSIVDLCFAYARAQPWLAGIVVGAETAAQMAKNIELFREPALTPDQIRLLRDQVPSPIPESLLDPSQWSKI